MVLETFRCMCSFISPNHGSIINNKTKQKEKKKQKDLAKSKHVRKA